MASPFRLNKKSRRRGRKLAKRLGNEEGLEKWDEASANSFRRIAELALKQANSKRRKDRPNSPK
jgi:hypothetical protein